MNHKTLFTEDLIVGGYDFVGLKRPFFNLLTIQLFNPSTPTHQCVRSRPIVMLLLKYLSYTHHEQGAKEKAGQLSPTRLT